MKKIIGLFMLSILLLSCNGYYKAITVNNPTDNDCYETLNMKKKYFVLHSDSAAFGMDKVSITGNDKNIKCILTNLPDIHTLHLGKNKKLKYKIGNNEYDETAVLNEVHLYLKPNTVFAIGFNEISVEKVNKIEVLEKDKQKTHKKHAIGWGVAAATTVVIAALAIESSLSKFKF